MKNRFKTPLSNCVKITSTFPSLGDASTLVGMTVLEEVILIIILSYSVNTIFSDATPCPSPFQ